MLTKKSAIILQIILLFLSLVACTSFLSQRTSEPPKQDTSPDRGTQSAEVSATETPVTADENQPESYALPAEFVIYQDYLDVIDGRAPRPDTGVIEGTVIEINEGQRCPYQEEQCSIPPYPSDSGLIRIDKILEYTAYENRPPNPVEESDDPQEAEEGVVSSEQNLGQDVAAGRKETSALTKGQEVEALFLLTANPVKVRYAPYNAKNLNGAEERGQISGGETETTTVQLANQPSEKTYHPIPTDGEMFVFTTQIGDSPNPTEKILSGLREGAKFRAPFKYVGTLLLIEEYELME